MKFRALLKTSIIAFSVLILVMTSFFFGSLSTAPAMAAEQDSILEEVTLQDVFEYLNEADTADISLAEIFDFFDQDGDASITKTDVVYPFSPSTFEGNLISPIVGSGSSCVTPTTVHERQCNSCQDNVIKCLRGCSGSAFCGPACTGACAALCDFC